MSFSIYFTFLIRIVVSFSAAYFNKVKFTRISAFSYE